MQNYDFFDCRAEEDGTFTIMKNCEPFLTCTGSEMDARNLVRMLKEDNADVST